MERRTWRTEAELRHWDIPTPGEYVADIRARRKEEQQSIAYRLHRLGWTQEEIAEGTDITRQQFRGFLGDFPDLEKEPRKLLDSGIPHLDVAERYSLPLMPIPQDVRLEVERLGSEPTSSLTLTNPHPASPLRLATVVLCAQKLSEKFLGTTATRLDRA
jgi:hypothetical protein